MDCYHVCAISSQYHLGLLYVILVGVHVFTTTVNQFSEIPLLSLHTAAPPPLPSASALSSSLPAGSDFTTALNNCDVSSEYVAKVWCTSRWAS